MKGRRRGLGVLIAGLVFMVLLAPAAFFGGLGVAIYQGVQQLAGAPVLEAGASQHFRAGEKVLMLPLVGDTANGNGVHHGSARSGPACLVTGPNGSAVTVEPKSGDTTVDRDHQQYVLSGSFTATAAGEYRIDCGGAKALVLDRSFGQDIGSRAVLPIVIGLIVAFILGVVGLVMTIVGGLRWRRSRRRPAMDSDGSPLTR